MSDPLDRMVGHITASMQERGYPPSVRELAAALGVSVGTVHKRLTELEEAGRIVRETSGGHTKAIRIIEGET